MAKKKIMSRNTTFLKDIQIQVLSWGIDIDNEKTKKIIMDFCDKITDIYNKTLEEKRKWVESLPISTRSIVNDDRDIIYTDVDKESGTLTLVYSDETKSILDMNKLASGNTGENRYNEDLFNQVMNSLNYKKEG